MIGRRVWNRYPKQGWYAAGAGLALLLQGGALAATALAPPAMYPPGVWQGRTQAVLRVLDRIDSHVELLTVPVGGTGTYRTLSVLVQACVSRPRTLASDAAVRLRLTDPADTAHVPFDGWMLAGEPSLGTYGNALYDVRVVACEGELVAPQAGPLPPASVPSVVVTDVPADEGGDDATVTPMPGGGGPASGSQEGPVPLAPTASAPIPLAPEGPEPQWLAPSAPGPSTAGSSSGQLLPPPQPDPGLE